MWSSVVLLGALCATAGPREVDARVPVALLVLVPKGVAPALRTADLLRLGDPLLRAITDLELVELGDADAALRACSGDQRLACWVQNLEHARWLLVLSPLPGDAASVQVSSMLVDVSAARDIIEGASSEGMSAVMNRVFEEATVHAPRRRLASAADDQIEGYLKRLFEEDLRERWTTAAHWRPFAELEVAAPEGLLLEIDGSSAGPTQGPLTRVRLRQGRRQVVVKDVGQETLFERQVDLQAGGQVRIEVVMPEPKGLDLPLLAVGGAAAAVGLAGLIYGTVRGNSVDVCYVGDCDGDRQAFDGFVPIGVGLLVSGLFTAAGSLFSDADWIWWYLGGGLAAGLAAGGIAAAL